MAGGTTAVLAAVLGVTSLTAGAPKATEIAPATHLPSALPTTPSGTPSAAGEQAGSPVGRPPFAQHEPRRLQPRDRRHRATPLHLPGWPITSTA